MPVRQGGHDPGDPLTGLLHLQQSDPLHQLVHVHGVLAVLAGGPKPNPELLVRAWLDRKELSLLVLRSRCYSQQREVVLSPTEYGNFFF